ncbi:hypothetical protein [Burkholderia ubonensis]|uniref:SpaN/EivJ family type III secretion system needle length determinant n=1 Tax=Burkholderia ubonensis TaxID=101571 RepID=UPI000B055E8F|nr:hypothetical protein [Burkholderia ubonensis]
MSTIDRARRSRSSVTGPDDPEQDASARVSLRERCLQVQERAREGGRDAGSLRMEEISRSAPWMDELNRTEAAVHEPDCEPMRRRREPRLAEGQTGAIWGVHPIDFASAAEPNIGGGAHRVDCAEAASRVAHAEAPPTESRDDGASVVARNHERDVPTHAPLHGPKRGLTRAAASGKAGQAPSRIAPATAGRQAVHSVFEAHASGLSGRASSAMMGRDVRAHEAGRAGLAVDGAFGTGTHGHARAAEHDEGCPAPLSQAEPALPADMPPLAGPHEGGERGRTMVRQPQPQPQPRPHIRAHHAHGGMAEQVTAPRHVLTQAAVSSLHGPGQRPFMSQKTVAHLPPKPSREPEAHHANPLPLDPQTQAAEGAVDSKSRTIHYQFNSWAGKPTVDVESEEGPTSEVVVSTPDEAVADTLVRHVESRPRHVVEIRREDDGSRHPRSRRVQREQEDQ